MRGLTTILAACALAACTASTAAPAPEPPLPPTATLGERMHAYATSVTVRRRALEESLVVRDNGYARLRLSKYDDAHWGALPVFDPPTAPIRVAAKGGAAEPPADDASSWSTVDDGADDWSEGALRALGERAFFHYPVQMAPNMGVALDAPDHGGVWSHEGTFGGVYARLPASTTTAFTCATCHATADGGRLVVGRNNADVDAGRILHGFDVGWGRGRVDVTNDRVDNPVAITDLRPIRHQVNLHHAATLKNDPVALAVRIETLIVTSSDEAIRPPRRIVAGLTVFLLSLSDADAPRETTSDGARVFARECSRCHDSDGAAGVAVALETVGTDPLVGASTDRGTGTYRVPSLRHVGDRRRMFASGAIDDLDALLDPHRTVAGHRYGLALGDAERRVLLDYLRQL